MGTGRIMPRYFATGALFRDYIIQPAPCVRRFRAVGIYTAAETELNGTYQTTDVKYPSTPAASGAFTLDAATKTALLEINLGVGVGFKFNDPAAAVTALDAAISGGFVRVVVYEEDV